eukprot:Skav227562  [mRNA]  locus=scaffold154:23023:23892:- [translate_table: standard]
MDTKTRKKARMEEGRAAVAASADVGAMLFGGQDNPLQPPAVEGQPASSVHGPPPAPVQAHVQAAPVQAHAPAERFETNRIPPAATAAVPAARAKTLARPAARANVPQAVHGNGHVSPAAAAEAAPRGLPPATVLTAAAAIPADDAAATDVPAAEHVSPPPGAGDAGHMSAPVDGQDPPVSDVQCCICQQPIARDGPPGSVEGLPCSHVFHTECLRPWRRLPGGGSRPRHHCPYRCERTAAVAAVVGDDGGDGAGGASEEDEAMLEAQDRLQEAIAEDQLDEQRSAELFS